MPRCLMVCFSQGGTTARVAESIAAGLSDAKIHVDLHNIKDSRAPLPDDYDMLGIGAPTYYYRPPFNIMDYLHSLPELIGLPVFVFVLHGTYQGDAGNIIRHTLTRKGATEIGYFDSLGADLFLGYLQQGYFFSPHHPTTETLIRAESFGRDLAAIHSGRKEYTPAAADPSPKFVYRLERFLTNRWFTKHFYSRMFTVNRKTCTACGLCMKECPTGNISENEKGHPVWNRNCLLCQECEMKCPKDAITSPVSWPLFRPFMMYNVHRAARDAELEFVRVRHAMGRTRKVE